MQRRKIKDDDDGFGLTFPDVLMGTIGSGAIIGMLLMANLGIRVTQPEKQLDITEILKDYLEELQQQAKVIAEVEDDANEVRQQLVALNAQRQQDVGDFAEHAARLADAKAAAEQRAMQAEMQSAKLRDSRSVRLICCLDTSASMSAATAHVRETVKMLTQSMPHALTSFELGVIGYRAAELNEFKLLPIVHPSEDGGASTRAVEHFLDQLSVETGVTCIDKALQSAMERLDGGGSPGGSDIIVIVADVGPGDQYGYNAPAAEKLISDVAAWANQGSRNRRVLSLQVGVMHGDHKPFFQKLGQVTDESRFSSNMASMFPLVFEAAFIRSGEES